MIRTREEALLTGAHIKEIYDPAHGMSFVEYRDHTTILQLHLNPDFPQDLKRLFNALLNVTRTTIVDETE